MATTSTETGGSSPETLSTHTSPNTGPMTLFQGAHNSYLHHPTITMANTVQYMSNADRNERSNAEVLNALFERLIPRAQFAEYDAASTPRNSCTKNTRKAILDALQVWAKDKTTTKVYWLNGIAGIGKTTVAYSFSEILDEEESLGATFFASRLWTDTSDVRCIIPTISLQLARHLPSLSRLILNVVEVNPGCSSWRIRKQFLNFMVKPLTAAYKDVQALGVTPVIILDALDKYLDQSLVTELLSLILKYSGSLPVKFFITSRPELVLKEILDDHSNVVLYELEKEIAKDVVEKEIERNDVAKETVKASSLDLPEIKEIILEHAGIQQWDTRRNTAGVKPMLHAREAATTPMSHIPTFGFCSPAFTKGDVRLKNKGSQVGVGASGVCEEGAGPHSDEMKDVLRGCKRVVIIGIHGWLPSAKLPTVVGKPTGTSTKLANMTEQALQQFEDEYGVKLEKITKIPLKGNGTIDKRVERLYNKLTANEGWMTDLHEAEAIIISTHSQGSIVATHLLNLLIQDNHITTAQNHHLEMSFGTGAETFLSAVGIPGTISRKKRKVQRVCCMALCGIHLGPWRYLNLCFDSTAERELLEFRNTESTVSKAYVKSLQNVLDHGIKFLYVASLNDQVVPIYSGLFTAVSHPLILRTVVDKDVYHSSDFVSNFLVLLIRILNSGISDFGLIAYLTAARPGYLNGDGHSTAYEELTTFTLAVKYLFLDNEGMTDSTELRVKPFNANKLEGRNDYDISRSLRDIFADEQILDSFSRDIAEFKDAFCEWHPETLILRDLKHKLQPIIQLPSSTFSNPPGSGIDPSHRFQ